MAADDQDLEATPDYMLSADRRRAYSRQLFGTACYLVRLGKDGKLHGYHQGVVGTEEDAELWLEKGEKGPSFVKVYP